MATEGHLKELEDEISRIRLRLLSISTEMIKKSTDESNQEYERLSWELETLKQERREFGLSVSIVQVCEKRGYISREMKKYEHDEWFGSLREELCNEKKACEMELVLLDAKLTRLLDDWRRRGFPDPDLSVFDKYGRDVVEEHEEMFHRDAIEFELKDMKVDINFSQFTTDDLRRIMAEETEKKWGIEKAIDKRMKDEESIRQYDAFNCSEEIESQESDIDILLREMEEIMRV